MSPTPVGALPVALMHLSDSMRNTLEVFFESRLCPLNILVVPPADAHVGIFDHDHPKSREEADAWLKYREDDQVILVSLRQVEKDGAICLTKPIKPKALLAAFEQALTKREQTSEPNPVQVTRVEPEPKQTPESRDASKVKPSQARKSRRKQTSPASSSKAPTKKKSPPKNNRAAKPARPDKPAREAILDTPEKVRHEAVEKPSTAPRKTAPSPKTEKQTNVVSFAAHGQGTSILPDASLDKLLQDVNWQLDYGDVNKARQMLEEALDENPKQSILHHEILQLYGWTSDHEHFYAMYEKLDMNEVPYAEKWIRLKDFFDQTD